MQQLGRIGCQVSFFAPPPEPPECQLLVLAATPQWVRTPQPWLRSPQPMPLIAIVTYESPTILDYLLEIEAAQVLATPFRTSGLLSSLMLVLQGQQIRQRLENKNKRLRTVISCGSLFNATWSNDRTASP